MRCSRGANLISSLVFSLEAHLFFLYPSIPLSLNDHDRVAASVTKHLLYKAIPIQKQDTKNIKVLTLLFVSEFLIITFSLVKFLIFHKSDF